MPAKGTDTATIRAWVNDLTFGEVHAMLYGFVHGSGTVGAWILGFNAVALALVGAFFVLNGWWRTERTKGLPLVSSILESLPDRVLGQIRDELHYYDGLWAGGFVLALTVAFYFGVLPVQA